MLGFPLLYFKGMRLMMFQLSSFYCKCTLLSFSLGSLLVSLEPNIPVCVGYAEKISPLLKDEKSLKSNGPIPLYYKSPYGL